MSDAATQDLNGYANRIRKLLDSKYLVILTSRPAVDAEELLKFKKKSRLDLSSAPNATAESAEYERTGERVHWSHSFEGVYLPR